MGVRMDSPGQFTDTGAPRPGTAAAKIGDELEVLFRADNFEASLTAADAKVKEIEEALVRFRRQRERELLAALLPEAEEAREAWMRWAAEGEQHLHRLIHLATRARRWAIAGRTYERSPIADYQHQSAALKMVTDAPAWPLPVAFLNEVWAEDE